MFCPQCESEYRAGFTRCRDCDVLLVDRLPPAASETGESESGPVTVFIAANLSEADLVKSLLEGSGIEASLSDENLSRIDFPVAILSGGVKVAVPEHQEELAREVLKDYRSGAGQDPLSGRVTSVSPEEQGVEEIVEGGEEEYRCSHCRAHLEAEATVCPECGQSPF